MMHKLLPILKLSSNGWLKNLRQRGEFEVLSERVMAPLRSDGGISRYGLRRCSIGACKEA